METFVQLFGSFLLFSYHCFDRIVINGYLSMLSRPENVVYFFRDILGIRPITKEVLRQRTLEYRRWVEAFARNHGIPMQWAEKGVRKEDFVLPWRRRMERENRFGVYFIFQSMEQGSTFRARMPKYATADADYRILAKARSRFMHYYFYIRDEILGPMVVRVATFFPFQTTYYLNGHSFIERELVRLGVAFRKNDNAFLTVSDPAAIERAAARLDADIIRKRLDYWTLIVGPKFSRRERSRMNLNRFYAVAQIEYCRNFIFQKRFPIRKIFERSCDLGLWRMTARKISELFGLRITRKLRGKLQTTLDRIDQGHHVLRVYCKNAFLKQYEKFSCFLRNELCSNNLADFGLKKGLEHLDAVRRRLGAITDRFASFQAEWLNLHGDFSLLERLARPIRKGSTRTAGIKLHDTRMIRLMEILLDAGTKLGGWSARQMHEALLARFRLSPESYGIHQLRYDLRKLRAHGLVGRDGHRYVYALTEKGTRTALLFLLFHQRVFGPLAHSQFVRRPDARHCPESRLEKAYRRADAAIDTIVALVRAA